MGRTGKRLGKENVSWWPAVKNYLQTTPHDYVSSKQIIAEAKMLGRTRRDRVLARSPHCPHPATLSRFLSRNENVVRKKVESVSVVGSKMNIYVFRWSPKERKD